MAKGTPQWTDEQLMELSDHLGYEVEMFFKQGAEAASLYRERKAGARLNALNEAFFVHARTLLRFLYLPSSRFPDEVLATHYLNGGSMQMPQQLLALDLERLEDRMNRQILHLSCHRLTLHPLREKWPHEPLMEAMKPAISEFYDRLVKTAPQRVHERLKKAVTEHCSTRK